ncbi:MAG: 50S ribosomal protein L4 [Nanoarchaeota archaeon]|nr:50S ribosomal protein L4 [Nanoarchaeota archaeon]MEC8339161.1 50S ribosomal protein L4 [Nanoarchaeota archaeon]
MKIPVIDKEGKKVSDFEFDTNTLVRDDIFKKAYLAENSLFFQSYGSDPKAGKKQVINLSKRRKAFRTTYGRGGSRTPKKVMWARGTQHRYVGAWVSQAVGGRRAHPPKAEKKTIKTMNNKEWMKALLTGVSASFDKVSVEANGQRVPEQYPVVLDSSVETLAKTSDFKSFLEKAGFSSELERLEVKKVRAGKGTMRNRKYKTKRGPLVVVSNLENPLFKAARNVQGFDVVTPDLLMVQDFGMSEKPGRAVLFTKAALEEFSEVMN